MISNDSVWFVCFKQFTFKTINHTKVEKEENIIKKTKLKQNWLDFKFKQKVSGLTLKSLKFKIFYNFINLSSDMYTKNLN